MATPPRGTKLSLGKLGRATAVGNSDNTSKTSLNDAGRDSSTSKTKISDFFIGSVDNSLTGNQYVDEQTNEIYTMTFGDENSLFQSRIASRHQNFTWTTGDSDLFAIQSNQDFTAQYNAGAIAEAATAGVGRISKSFEDNLVTDFDFNAWDDSNSLTNWYESGGSVISKNSITTAPSASNDFAVRFDTEDGFITQSFNIKGNSTYEIVAHTSASSAGQIDLEISGAYAQVSFSAIQGELGEWYKFTNDFYSSGSTNTSHPVKLTFKAVSAPSGDKPLLDAVFFRRWEGANFSMTDQELVALANSNLAKLKNPETQQPQKQTPQQTPPPPTTEGAPKAGNKRFSTVSDLASEMAKGSLTAEQFRKGQREIKNQGYTTL